MHTVQTVTHWKIRPSGLLPFLLSFSSFSFLLSVVRGQHRGLFPRTFLVFFPPPIAQSYRQKRRKLFGAMLPFSVLDWDNIHRRVSRPWPQGLAREVMLYILRMI